MWTWKIFINGILFRVDECIVFIPVFAQDKRIEEGVIDGKEIRRWLKWQTRRGMGSCFQRVNVCVFFRCFLD